MLLHRRASLVSLTQTIVKEDHNLFLPLCGKIYIFKTEMQNRGRASLLDHRVPFLLPHPIIQAQGPWSVGRFNLEATGAVGPQVRECAGDTQIVLPASHH